MRSSPSSIRRCLKSRAVSCIGGEVCEGYTIVCVNRCNNIWVACLTNSSNLPLAASFYDELSGPSDFFLSECVVPGIWNCGLRFELEERNEYHPGDRFHLGVAITNNDPVSRTVEEYIIV